MRHLFLVLLAVLLTTPSFAKEPSEDAQAANRDAMALGHRLYLHDQAAWHGTDALRADIDFSDHPELRGYLAEPAEDGAMALIFYAENDVGHYQFARYLVKDSKVIGGGLRDQPTDHPLTAAQERMVAARAAVFDVARKEQYSLCTNSSPNFIVLPPGDDDLVSVYILSSTESADTYPLGGHFRVDFAADGTAESTRRYMNTCMNVNLRSPDGHELIRFVVTHILDQQPTEIHYFVSRNIPLSLSIITRDFKWTIEDGKLTDTKDM